MLVKPTQRSIRISRRTPAEDAVLKSHLRVVLAEHIAVVRAACREEHTHRRHAMADKGEILASAARLAARADRHVQASSILLPALGLTIFTKDLQTFFTVKLLQIALWVGIKNLIPKSDTVGIGNGAAVIYLFDIRP